MSDKNKNVIRFGVIYAFTVLLFLLIFIRLIFIMRNDYDALKKYVPGMDAKQVEVPANRGNIYSRDGQLMASSIPQYYIYMDTRVDALRKDTGRLFFSHVDSLSVALAKCLKDQSAQDYRRHLVNGYNQRKGRLLIHNKRINFMQLNEVKQMPLINQGRYKSGFWAESRYSRVRPYGSLAARTIGDIYGEGEKGGKSGLEKQFDEQLRGKPGKATRERVAHQWINHVQEEPVDGMDIYTTIDVQLQDITENALRNMLNRAQADWGCAVMMKVSTGEVVACSNLTRAKDSAYHEVMNYAVTRCEPGSTFKTAALMAAIDDGKVSIYDSIDTGIGRWVYTDPNHPITDWNHGNANWNNGRGGSGKILVKNALETSSNVAMAKIITSAYEKKPDQFIKKLAEMGLNEDLHFEIPGAQGPSITSPDVRETLARMSYGYSVDIPPLYTLMFYNAIANDGKMMRPYLCQKIVENGLVRERFSPQVVKSSLCSSSTLKQIQECLYGVVHDSIYATAGAARSPQVSISGKTGTARIIEHGTYNNSRHRISFVGYFPSEAPLYSCICVIHNPRDVAHSGGRICGAVVRQIAERTIAAATTRSTEDISSQEGFTFAAPAIKAGQRQATVQAARTLGVELEGEAAEWCRVRTDSAGRLYTTEINLDNPRVVPNVVGMGLKDAVYLIERCGMKAVPVGKGRVVAQSVQAGQNALKGGIVELRLN